MTDAKMVYAPILVDGRQILGKCENRIQSPLNLDELTVVSGILNQLLIYGQLDGSLNENVKQGGTMLIVTRRIGESVMIGPNGEITVTVLGVRGSQVRVGIEAPQEVPINREEIHQRILQERRLAKSSRGA